MPSVNMRANFGHGLNVDWTECQQLKMAVCGRNADLTSPEPYREPSLGIVTWLSVVSTVGGHSDHIKNEALFTFLLLYKHW